MTYLFRLSILFLSLFCTSNGIGQTTYVPVKVPAKYEKELDDAMLQFQGGNQKEAIKSIEGIVGKFPDWTIARQKLSRTYYETGQKQAAIEQLEASLSIDTMSQLNELYSLGRIYEEINEPERALGCYTAVIKKAAGQEALVQRATTSQQALEKKKALWDKGGDIVFTPFDSDINTPQHESLGRWTLDGQKMVFTRLVFDQEDIFFASFDTIARIWSIEDFAYNSPLNEGAHALSPDGNYLIFTSCNRQDGIGSCDLYLSFKDNGQWSRPTNMGPAFNSYSWDGQPCFGLDGLTLFYSSSRPGGMGGRDIWYVYQIAEGRWSNPINAGPAINTPDNEESPFVHFDGQTIYFMRDGKEGLGGYDLYISRKGIDGKWQKAENLGAPINSGVDEGALTLHPDGKRAIITRMTGTAKNDLFEFELPERFRATPTQALQVTIKDQVTGQPVRARVELFEISKQDTIRMSQWADLDGKISAVTSKNVRYGVMVSAEGYIMYSANLDADTSAVRQLAIMMTPLTAAQEKVIVLQNVFFESGSAALLPTSEPELNKLLWTLRKNVNMQIEIRGHTDNEGDEKSNLTLSEARAKAVYEYLAGRGITAERMSYKGFGETQPIADNATAVGRKQNRRTEFSITKM
ncbi:MAG: PD40 domain-containing protein [Saprospiraceae bacterium]|nr:PD40 domain-containing protein [Candidatus Opimibacter iunctus]